MNEEDKIVEELIAGGIIGAALGALISKNKGEGAIVGALAGAAIMATYKANEQAQKTNVPFYSEEDGVIYQIQPGGSKVFIRKIDKSTTKIPKRFKLK
ncbi:hypothetical protein [Flavobacterium sp.]|jgi:hypothetical protein|uniref:hypothetical protein n=1 Tax=Flavobacterium sp. TaxID=239 RepID=UPI0022C403FD|nr:hypothetical protein [Flavobacterium sp.]MCZ8169186.1 hypothetical protein [Flavobacterium sp.]MCZ8297759.1 hypothetical protein [Flavobacterium sp.]